MNSCNQVKDQLVDYADHELPPAECGAVEQHLESCPACRTTLAALKESLHLARILWHAEAAAPALPERTESAACGTGFQPVEVGRTARHAGQRSPQETADTEAGRYTKTAGTEAGRYAETASTGDGSYTETAAGSPGRAGGRCATRSVGSGLAAAAVLLAVTGALTWLLGPHADPASVASPSVEQVILAVEREGAAAQMLASASLLAEQPGGWPYAADQFQFITAVYPETAAAAGARTMLSTSLERSVTQ